MNEPTNNALSSLITTLASSFEEERKKTEPYKELFKAGSSYTTLFRALEVKMTGHVLDACTVLEEKFGVVVTKEQYHMLLALPLLVKIAEKDAEVNEGSASCVDKAFYMLSEHFKELGK